jgi:hypothetical protein
MTTSIPNPLPDTSTAAGAGPNMPIHVNKLGQQYFADPNAPGGVATDFTSLNPGGYLQGLTMDNVYRLLSKMIASLQNAAVVQSKRLQILTDWQNAYNSKLASVHSFTQNNGDALVSGSATNLSTDRQDLNNANTAYTQQMTAGNNIVSDDAKGMQTVINNTQSNVNNASNMATQLIQQFATILQSLYQP